MFLARFCCCCAKRNKDVYHVNSLPSYKTVEPLYVVTPPGRPLMPDQIYSTPYSGSPLPYPPPPGASVPVTPTSTYRHAVNRETPTMKKQHAHSEPGSIRRAPGSEYSAPGGVYAPPPQLTPPMILPPTELYGTITPTSTYRHAVNRETPTMKKPHAHSEPGSIRRAPGSEYSAPGGVYAPPPQLTPPMILPPTELYGTIPRATLLPRNGQLPNIHDPKDLPFLDPNRKQETQTREELIY
ncbi:hypothetical protein OESDEN_11863 [Oesophagostomum dentatum]|uniref:Uncharacterized protein n=1 Tax=Oesophagostomum dentatum TaxID=61180 RepID=A0A0B1STQ4_OESDE|nr:hypothetical protein OESDEN_11863 [Oesophagostomum dentatum]